MATSYGVKDRDEVKTRELPSKSFKEAFREARKEGNKTFTWNGKKYTTEYKEEAQAKALSKASKEASGAFRSRRSSAAMDEPKKEAPKPVKAAPRRESADIPVGKEKAPKKTGETTAGPSEVEKMLMGLPMVGGAAALGVGAMRAKRAAAASKAAAKEFTKPKAAATTANTGRRFTDKEEMEAATSAVRGAASRKDIQAKRAERQKLQEEYERMLDKYSKQKSSPRDRTREKAEFEFAKGGMAKKGKK